MDDQLKSLVSSSMSKLKFRKNSAKVSYFLKLNLGHDFVAKSVRKAYKCLFWFYLCHFAKRKFDMLGKRKKRWARLHNFVSTVGNLVQFRKIYKTFFSSSLEPRRKIHSTQKLSMRRKLPWLRINAENTSFLIDT